MQMFEIKLFKYGVGGKFSHWDMGEEKEGREKRERERERERAIKDASPTKEIGSRDVKYILPSFILLSSLFTSFILYFTSISILPLPSFPSIFLPFPIYLVISIFTLFSLIHLYSLLSFISPLISSSPVPHAFPLLSSLPSLPPPFPSTSPSLLVNPLFLPISIYHNLPSPILPKLPLFPFLLPLLPFLLLLLPFSSSSSLPLPPSFLSLIS